MKRIATLAAGIAVMVPGSAAAAGSSSTCQAYNPQLCTVAHNTGSGTPTPGSSTTTTTTAGNVGGTLPFTGLDVALLAVGGGGLLGTGLVVRRLSNRAD